MEKILGALVILAIIAACVFILVSLILVGERMIYCLRNHKSKKMFELEKMMHEIAANIYNDMNETYKIITNRLDNIEQHLEKQEEKENVQKKRSR